jgi:hypothetical protein
MVGDHPCDQHAITVASDVNDAVMLGAGRIHASREVDPFDGRLRRGARLDSDNRDDEKQQREAVLADHVGCPPVSLR